MTFTEALANPETRRMIDAIEDIRASLDGQEDDTILLEALENAYADFERKTGLDLRDCR